VRGFIQLYAQMQSVVKQMEASGMLRAPAGAAAQPAAKAAATKAPAKKKAAAKSKPASSGGRAKSKKS